jgi:tetratricopeptide (TPR) repeat protein
LIEKGSVRRESGRWRRCDVDQLVIPQSVKEAIGHRLNRVSADTNEVLRVCAILGKVFTFDDLTAAAEQNEDALLDALDEATGAQLISAGSDDSFSFTHDKIREVLYEELNPIRRRRLHRHVAEGLERNCDQVHCAVEKLAHHYIQAGDHERGLRYAKEAAAEAERVFAFDEAVAAYTRARDCAEALGLIEEQAAAEESIGKAYMLHAETALAAEHFERALGMTNDPGTRVRLLCQAAASLVTTGAPRGIDYVREALAVLDPKTNPLETANALSTEARFHHLAGRHQLARELLLRAGEIVQPTAESDSISSFAAPMMAQIYAYTAGTYQHSGLFDDADAWARHAVDFGVKHNVLFAQAAGTEFLGEDAVHKGNYEESLEFAQREIEMAAKLHSRERRSWVHFYEGQAHFYLERVERAVEEFQSGAALADMIGEKRVLVLLNAGLAIALAKLGDYDQALEIATTNLESAVAIGLLYTHFEALRGLAEVHFRRAQSGMFEGALDEAERVCRQAEALIDPTESRVSCCCAPATL